MPLAQNILERLEATFVPGSSLIRGRRVSEKSKQEAIQRQLEISLAQQKQALLDPRVAGAREQDLAAQQALAQIGQTQGLPPVGLPESRLAGRTPAQQSVITATPETRRLQRIAAGLEAKIPAPVEKDKKLTPVQKLTRSSALWDQDRGAAINLANSALAESGSTYRIPKDTPSQVGRGMADLMIDYNTATEKIDFNLPANAVDLDKIESGLLKDLVNTESYLRATPDNQTKMANAAGNFFKAKRKMRQKSRTVRETILDKVISGKTLTSPEQKVYDETIKRKDPQTPSEAGALQAARTTARLTAYREERTKAIETNDLDGLRSLITDAEEKLLGRADPEEVERLMWGTLEAHYRTKRKPEISPDEFERRGEELEAKYGYNEETIVRLLRLQFKVAQ